MNKVIVVGGGAAGIMAAIKASQMGKSVLLIERNEKLGKKLFITGKGRCNVTSSKEIEDIIKNIPGNGNFMYSSLYTFTNYDLMKMLEDKGVKLKVERGDRVFPESDKSSDIIRCFEKYLHENNVEIKLNTRVTDIICENDKVTGIKVLESGNLRDSNNGRSNDNRDDGSYSRNGNGNGNNLNKTVYKCDSLIIATGGKSYPMTGSTGDGYDFAEKLGHSIVEIKPSLVPLVSKDKWISQLMGVSLKNVKLSVKNKNKVIYSDFGEMLFTHFGISGPIVLSASRRVIDLLPNEVEVFIDLKPALDMNELDKRILRDFEKYINKQFKNALNDLLPQKLIPVIVELSGISPEKEVNIINREERLKLVKLIKEFKVTINGTRAVDEAIITRGGVSIKEVDPSTMESKLISGLYFAGEVLDVDALTGGFNLQVAFSTGYCAGENC
jgi:predicted flavoprotein YhiN